MRITAFGLMLLAVSFAACSDDSTPFGPEGLVDTELAFFPLQKGYKADYRYYYSRASRYWDIEYGESDNHWRKDGEFHLEVTDTYTNTTNKAIYYQIMSTLLIKSSYYYVSSHPQDTTWSIHSDSITTVTYNIMLQNGALWYVDNAQSFERLEEGDTTMMMASPIASGGNMSLELFPVRTFSGTPVKLSGFNTYVDTMYIYGYNSFSGDESTICKTKKNKGISVVSASYSHLGPSTMEDYIEMIELKE